jgi:hypothetical protein
VRISMQNTQPFSIDVLILTSSTSCLSKRVSAADLSAEPLRASNNSHASGASGMTWILSLMVGQ